MMKDLLRKFTDKANGTKEQSFVDEKTAEIRIKEGIVEANKILKTRGMKNDIMLTKYFALLKVNDISENKITGTIYGIPVVLERSFGSFFSADKEAGSIALASFGNTQKCAA